MVASSPPPSKALDSDLSYLEEETRVTLFIPLKAKKKLDWLKDLFAVTTQSDVLIGLLDVYEKSKGDIIPGFNDRLLREN